MRNNWGFSTRAGGRITIGVGVLALLGTTFSAATLATPSLAAASPRPVPHVGHVFVIVLENKGYAATFGNPGADPYLARTLPSQGALLTQYYATGHESNDNYISMISGQGPNLLNQLDCPVFANFLGTGPTIYHGQALGLGCVYPSSVSTIGDQLSHNHLSWKGYMQDMGNNPAREAAVCGHPALNGLDSTQTAVAGDGYVSRHDPFVYFHSIIDNQAYCAAHVVPLGTAAGALPPSAPVGTTGLSTDLATVASTPNLSFIVPNVCNDGHDFPCTNQASGSSALANTDAFLRTWVPLITHSPAFVSDGLLLVTFDESDGPQTDSSSCCGELPGPDTLLGGLTGLGGGRVGAVALSPYIAGGTVSNTAYNHYSLLASIEDNFAVPRLGYAADVPATFGHDIFR